MESEGKGQRLLAIYDRLNRGEALSKSALAEEYAVTVKSIQRDLDDIRTFLSESERKENAEIHYSRAKKKYELVNAQERGLNEKEVLALTKILLESRALEKKELNVILKKLVAACPEDARKVVADIIRNETFCYVPPRHGKQLLDVLWELSLFIRNKEMIHFFYKRQDGTCKNHTVKPVALMFSEYYFYLVAFTVEEPDYPTIFRVDRMSHIGGTGEHFQVPYKDRFKDGEFRKRVQFMYPGNLRHVTFTYCGPSVEAVLDRLPTAKIISEKDGVYTLTAEAYGKGIDMWLQSQGKWVKIIDKGIRESSAMNDEHRL